MKALDLSKAPPRGPREQLDGLDMMPRTIDKLRASLPDGNMGAYKIPGSSQRLLDFIGVDANELREVVARAKSEDVVAVWLRERVSPETCAQANATLSRRTLGMLADSAEFRGRYPIAKDLPDDTPIYTLLELDDAAMFPSSAHR